MIIAIPLAGGRLAAHFGHCEEFALVTVNDQKQPTGREQVTAPDHQPGLLPRWLAERQVNVVIAGGMGMRAQQLFAEQRITVIAGATDEDPDRIVRAYLDGTLQTGPNSCNH